MTLSILDRDVHTVYMYTQIIEEQSDANYMSENLGLHKTKPTK